MPDWADKRAEDVMTLILSPDVTLDDVAVVLAASFRLVEAIGAERGIRDVGQALNLKGEPS